MKKVLSRILSLVLTLAMVLTTLCISDFGLSKFLSTSANALTDVDENDYSKATYPSVSFYAPEAVYLTPGSNVSSDYLNYDYSTGKTKDGTDKTGSLYFSCPKATSVTLTAGLYSSIYPTKAASSESVTVALKNGTISATGGTANVSYAVSSSSVKDTMNKITLSAIQSGTTSYIEWTATYVVGSSTYYANSYTAVYSPYLGQAGMSVSDIYSGGSVTLRNDAYSFITGISDVSGGNSQSAITSTSSATQLTAPLVSFKGTYQSSNEATVYYSSSAYKSDALFVSGGSGVYEYASQIDNQNKIWPTYSAAYAKICVDISRYSDYSQIPNLSAGWAQFYHKWDSASNRLVRIDNAAITTEKASDYVENNTGYTSGSVTIKCNTDVSDFSGQKSYASGLYPLNGATPSATGTKNDYLRFGYMNGSKDSTGSTNQYVVSAVGLTTVAVDKSDLRKAYSDAVNSGICESLLTAYNSKLTLWSTYTSALRNAAYLLGNQAADSQSDINTAASALSSLVSEYTTYCKSAITDDSVYFFVPETIYLKPAASAYSAAGSYAFQYYANETVNTTNHTYTLSTGETTTGSIYFYCASASSVTLKCSGTSTATVKQSSSATETKTISSSVGAEYSYTSTGLQAVVTAGASDSIAAASSGSYIKWTASYVDSDGYTKTATAYSYCYKPYLQPVGSMVSTCNDSGSDHYGSMIGWVSGVHGTSTTGNYYPNYTVSSSGYGFSPISSSNSSSGVQLGIAKTELSQSSSDYVQLYAQLASTTQASSYFYYTDMSNVDPGSWGASAKSSTTYAEPSMTYDNFKNGHSSDTDVLHVVNAYSALTVDMSRYSNLNQIPNLSAGLMVTNDQASASGRGAWYVSDYTGSAQDNMAVYPYKGNSSGDYSLTSIWNDYGKLMLGNQGSVSNVGAYEREGVKFNSKWNTALSSSVTDYSVKACYYNDDGSSSDRIIDAAITHVITKQYNKGTLRSACAYAIKYSNTLYSDYYNTSSQNWVNYQNIFDAAQKMLTTVNGTLSFTATVNGSSVTYTDPATLATALRNAVDALLTGTDRNVGTSTENYVAVYMNDDTTCTLKSVTKNSKVIESKETDYYYGTTVSLVADDFDGYDYLGYIEGATEYTAGTASLTFSNVQAALNTATINKKSYIKTSSLSITYYYLVGDENVSLNMNGGSYNYLTMRTTALTNSGYPSYVGSRANYTIPDNGSINITTNTTSTADCYEFTPYRVYIEAGSTYKLEYNVDFSGGSVAANPVIAHICAGENTAAFTGGNVSGLPSYYVMSNSNDFTFTANDTGYAMLRLSIQKEAATSDNTIAEFTNLRIIKVNDNTDTKSIAGAYPSAQPISKPYKNGYTFAGWSSSGLGSGNYGNSTLKTVSETASAPDTNYTQGSSSVKSFTEKIDSSGDTYVNCNYSLDLTSSTSPFQYVSLTPWKNYTVGHRYILTGSIRINNFTYYSAEQIGDDQSAFIIKNSLSAGDTSSGLEFYNTTDGWVSINSGGLVAGNTDRYLAKTVTASSSPRIEFNLYTCAQSLIDNCGCTNVNVNFDLKDLQIIDVTDSSAPETVYSQNGYQFGVGSDTLEANWVADKYTVTFDANGGVMPTSVAYDSSDNPIYTYGSTTNTTSKAVVTYGDPYGDAIMVPQRTGYDFDGWYNGNTKITAATVCNLDADCTLTAKWVAKNYNLTINPSGGLYNGSSSVATITQGYQTNYTVSVPQKTGYQFTGWTRTGAFGKITSLTQEATYTFGLGNDGLTASWTAGTFTLAYDANGGTGAPENKTLTYDTSSVISISTPVRTGYTFAGWSKPGETEISWTPSNCTLTKAQINAAYLSSTNGTYTIVAQWTVNLQNVSATAYSAVTSDSQTVTTYTKSDLGGTAWVTDKSGGTTQISSILCDTQAYFIASAKTGYTFEGWYSSAPNATTWGTKISSDNEYSQTINQSTTIYARFDIQAYNVTVAGSYYSTAASSSTLNSTYSNGSQAGTTQIYASDTSSTAVTQAYYNTYVCFKAVSATGYTFEGWYAAAPNGNVWGTALSVQPSYTVTIKANTGIYARFELMSYDVSVATAYGNTAANVNAWAANASAGNASTNSAKCYYGKSVTLTATANTGYKFAGWASTQPINSTVVIDNSNSSYNPVITSNSVFYARFDVESYTVGAVVYGNSSLIPNTWKYGTGGSAYVSASNGSTDAISSAYYGSTVYFNATPKTGYTFDGWFADSTLSTPVLSTDLNYAAVLDGNIVKYAKFSVASYNLAVSPMFNSADSLSTWSKGTSGGIAYAAATASSTEPIASAFYNTKAYFKATPATGYTFGGWYSTDSLETSVSSSAIYTASITSAVSLFAKFNINTYSVSAVAYGNSAAAASSWTAGTGGTVYVADSESSTDSITTAAYGQTVYYKSEALIGYKFSGWYSSDIFTGTPVSTDGVYSSAITLAKKMYARFDVVSYDLSISAYGNSAADAGTYKINIGGSAYAAESVSSTTPITSAGYKQNAYLKAIANTGYSFNGWYSTTDFNASAISTLSTYTVQVTDNITAFAKFSINSFSVTAISYGNSASALDTWTPGIGGTAFAANSAASNDGISTVYSGSTVYYKAVPSTGYSFTGWYTSATVSGTCAASANPCQVQINRDYTLYARFDVISVTVTISAGDHGTAVSPSTITGYYAQQYSLSGISVTPSIGYTHSGWTLNEGSGTLTGTNYTFGATTAVITAIYTPKKFDVQFNANSGIGAPAAVKATYDAALNLPVTEPINDGFLFLGWSLQSSATAATWAAGAQISAAEINAAYETASGSTCTLYAVWSPIYFEAASGSTTVIDNDSMTIYGLDQRLTASAIKNDYLKYQNVDVSIELNVGRFAGTGSLITLTYPDGTVKVYTIIVYGDINGDGIINQNDSAQLRSDILQGDSAEYDSVQFAAANINCDKRVNISDVTCITRHVLGMAVIDQQDPSYDF